MISTWKARCGIAAYAKNLTKNMLSQILVFTPFEEEDVDEILGNEGLNTDSHIKTIPSWRKDVSNDQKLIFLGERIIDSGVASLIIQFNYGFFDFTELETLIKRILASNIKVFIMMHTTIDAVEVENKKLIKLVRKFR